MKKILSAAAMSAALLMCGTSVHAQTAADTQFETVYKREWAWRQAELRGEVDEDNQDAVSARLAKVDAATQAMRLKYWENVEAQLKAIKVADLSPEQQVNYAVYQAQIEVLIANQRFKDYEKPLNADTAFWSNLSGVARRKLLTERDYRNYIAQLNDFPRYFDEQIVNMRAGLKRGFTPPKITLQGRDGTIVSVTNAKAPEDVAYYAPFKTFPATFSPELQAELRAQGLDAVKTGVLPAYGKLKTFYQTEYEPKARTELGAVTLPDGKAYYQAKIKEFTTLDLTADQVHEIGQKEVAAINARMKEVMAQTGFKGDLPQFLNFLRTDPQFYAKTPEELLMRAAWISKKFDGKAEQYFGYLPRKRFAIIPVPDDIAPFYTSGRGGPGVYLVNTYNLPARGLYSLPALTLHESAPGHAFQMPLAAEQQQPDFRRKSYISAFGEGWALYTEKLGEEMGMYETPYELFGMLSYQQWRASRLVVDTGIHAKGWTRKQAQDFLAANTALAEHEITTEVDRYIAWPGQALSYYLGEMEIVNARARAEKALGPKFDIRNFHDTVLQLGSVTLPVLNARVDRFIAEGGPSPYTKADIDRP
ncbi:MAG: DUF885 family protein [Caulobacter sp.]